MKNKLFCGILITLSIPASQALDIEGAKLNIGPTGSNTVAASSGAVGEDNIAAEWGFATGYGNTATMFSLAGGVGSQIIGDSEGVLAYGTALTVDTLYYSAVFGGLSSVDGGGAGESALLMSGLDNRVLRSPSSTHAGQANVVLGQNNTIDTTGINASFGTLASVLIGSYNTTYNSESWVIGRGNIGQERTVTLGTYASSVSDASLIVGTGTGTGVTPRTNGLVVLKNGTVQIPSGSLVLGSEPALTATSATTAGFLTKGPGASSDSHFAFGGTASGIASATIGNGAVASGTASYAFGSFSKSYGTSSVAIGNRAEASAHYTYAAGYQSLASANYSTAIGFQAKATGLYALAFQGGESSGLYSVSFNHGKATGISSFATLSSTASGNCSIALAGNYPGSGTSTASGYSAALVGGAGSIASGDVSFTSGFQTNSEAAHSAVFGSRNLSAGAALTGSATTWVENDALFEVGNGVPSASPAVYSNAITTLKNGQTTLANKFWSAGTPKAVPAAADASAGEALVVDGHTRLNGKVTLTQAQGDISMGIYE